MRHRHHPILVCLVLALALAAAPAAADTWYVSTTSGSIGGAGTPGDPFLYIQQGLDAAAVSGDVVVVMPGTYTGAGNRDLATLGKAVIVRGQFGAASSVIDVGSASHDGFYLNDTGEDQDTRIEGLTIRTARHGIRMRLEGTAPVIEDCVFESNSTSGVLYEYLGGTLDALDIVNCDFLNHAGIAADIDVWLYAPLPASRRDPFAILDHCDFENNGTGVRSGMPGPPLCQVAHGTFSGNDLASYGSLDLYYCDVTGGIDGFGGEVEYEPHHIHATQCDITGLTGVVFDDAQEIYVIGCTIDGNAGDIHTGGPSEEAYQILSFEGCAITDNGGGLQLGTGYVSQSTLTLVDCLYAGNGGPVSFSHLGGYGSLTVTGTTIAHNTGDGLVVDAAYGGAVIEHTIIAANGGAGLRWNHGSATWTIGCSDLWGNGGGNYVGLPDQTGIPDNISDDPLFCDPAAGVYHLYDDSPCLPAATGCGLMGARDVGCWNLTTWYVATWGSDTSGIGTLASPFRTVQVGLDHAAAGDTVIVHDGTYPEALEITRGVLLTSASNLPDQCVLAGIPTRRVLTIHTAPDTVTIRGFDITGGRPTIGDYLGLNMGGGLLAYGPPLVLEHCRIHDNATPLAETSTGGGGLHTRDGSYLRLVDCEVFDNVSYRAGGILHRSDGDFAMYGTLVYANSAELQGGGLWLLPPTAGVMNAVIARSTIAGNLATIRAGGLEAYQCDLNLANTIVAFNTGGASQVQLADCTGLITCNDLYDPSGGPVFLADPDLPRPDDIEADPWFCRKFFGDFRLLEISPCAAAQSGCGQIGARDVGCTYTEAPDAVPDACVLHPPRPNPFNARVVLSFSLAQPSPARLEIIDLRGAVIAVPVAADLPRGEHQAVWSGIDHQGHAAAAGVYLVRLTTNTNVQTQRLALIK